LVAWRVRAEGEHRLSIEATDGAENILLHSLRKPLALSSAAICVRERRPPLGDFRRRRLASATTVGLSSTHDFRPSTLPAVSRFLWHAAFGFATRRAFSYWLKAPARRGPPSCLANNTGGTSLVARHLRKQCRITRRCRFCTCRKAYSDEIWINLGFEFSSPALKEWGAQREINIAYVPAARRYRAKPTT
jgi:hypothetical protein